MMCLLSGKISSCIATLALVNSQMNKIPKERGRTMSRKNQRHTKHHPQKHPRKKTPIERSNQIQMPRPETNERVQITVVPEFANAASGPVSSSPEGAPGYYVVTFLLAVPGKEQYYDALDFAELLEKGNSLLAVPSPVAQIKVTIFNDHESQDMICFPNAQGALAKVQMRLSATSFTDAGRQAFDLAMANLSWWSYHHDVALDIAGYHILEEQTQSHRVVVGLVGKTKAWDGNILNAAALSDPKFRPLFAAYREGANASNPFYQLLCFYKVADGAKALRDQRRKATLSAGEQYQNPEGETLPEKVEDLGEAYRESHEAFQPYLGQSFTKVLDQFRGLFRNAIAHLDPTGATGNSLCADKFDDIVMCEQAIPVVRYISRVRLRNEVLADSKVAAVHIL